MWASTRDPSCPPDVKNLLNSVARPNSALNRLGSYVSWGLKDLCPFQMSNNGMYYKETNSVSQY